MTQTLILAEFLLARIAEDEATARYAMTRGAPTDEDFGGWWLGHYDHATRHSPERVLAECEAKRRVVEIAGPAIVKGKACGEQVRDAAARPRPCPTPTTPTSARSGPYKHRVA